MKMRAMVVGDQLVNREANENYRAWSGRQLLVIDQDDTPLQAILQVNIELDDPISPWGKGAPSLVGHVITLSIVDLSTYEKSKKIAARGKLQRIEGIMRFESVGTAASGEKVAK